MFWGYHHFGNPHICGDTNPPPKIKLQNYGLGSDLPLLGEGFLTVKSYCQKRVCLHFELANGCTPENSVGTQKWRFGSDDFPDFNWVMFSFQPFIFRGVVLEEYLQQDFSLVASHKCPQGVAVTSSAGHDMPGR